MAYNWRDSGSSAAAGSEDAQEAAEELRGDDDGGGSDDGGDSGSSDSSSRRRRSSSRGQSGPDRTFETEEEEAQSPAEASEADQRAIEEAREAGRRLNQDEGDPDEVNGGDDPDRGDDSTDRLRPDADSDPMNRQTETTRIDDGESVAAGSRQAREARARLAGYEDYSGPASAVEAGLDVRESFANVSGTEQGLEESGSADEYYNVRDPDSESRTIRRSERELAQMAEEEFLEQNPQFEGEDVRIVRDGSGFGFEFTAEGEQQRRLMQEEAAREAIATEYEEQVGSDVDPGDVVLQSTREGYTGGLRDDVLREINQEQQAEAEGRIERQLEQQVGRQGGTFASAMAGPQAEAEGVGPYDVELERGPDADYVIRPTDSGVTAELTEQFQEEQARQLAEMQFESATGVDLDPETDIRVEDGRATLTERGERRVATSDAGELQSDTPITSVRAVGFDRLGTALMDRRPGEVPLPIGPPGTETTIPLGDDAENLAYDAEQAYTERIVDPVASVVGDIDEVTLTSAAGAGEAVSRGEIPVPVLPTGTQPVGVSVPDELSTFQEAEARGALQFGNIGASAGTTIDAVEFGRAGAEAVGEGRGRQFGSATREAGVEAIESGVEYARENPVEFAGGATGALVGSTVIMGGAASLSRGAGQVSRLAIQPGEEILGYGGYGATRRVAGTQAADRWFPNQEPLIFSEEAAIRGARYAGSRLAEGAGRARSAASRINVRGQPGIGFGGLRIEVESETESPDFDTDLTDALREAERGAMLRRAEAGAEMQMQERQEELRSATEPQEYVSEALSGGELSPRPGRTLSRDVGRTRARLRQPGPTPAQQRAFTGGRVSGETGRVEAAQASSLETETDVGRRFESAILNDVVPAEDIMAGQESLIDTTSIEAQDVRSDVASEPALELATDMETGAEFLSEAATEFETGAEFEFDFEFEFETEAEFAAETELTRELEVERDDTEPRESDDVILGPRQGYARRLERDLINPFTGE